MKRFFIFILLAVAAAGCDDNKSSLEVYRRVLVDFEGEAWSNVVATNASSYDFMTSDYVWEDSHSSLTSRPKFSTSAWGSYYGGGCTVSNFGSNNLEEHGSYSYDLYVYSATQGDAVAQCGADGSDNFLVFYGNYDETVVDDVDCRPEIYFSDGKPRIVENCKINSTTYFVNIAENGNEFSQALREGDEIKVYATGVDAQGIETATVTFTLATYGRTVKEWTSWDLSPLGEVVRVRFNILGGPTSEYGITTPKYFALDNIQLKWQVN